MTNVPDNTRGEEASQRDGEWKIDASAGVQAGKDDGVGKALDLLIDGELKLLAIYDARQASADTRTTALATAAIGLPTLILALSRAFASHAMLLKVGYVLTIVVAFIIIVGARSWNAWRRRRTDAKHPGPLISAEAADVAKARHEWRDYQRATAVGSSDPIRVKQLALEMWRTRAITAA